ncbi:MAG TPA: SDR family oxidoreductase [Solirubrobacteraceae bacterium]|nr:SDR family oxidoreductase [Solirubrobacteraceae bacterium]
MRVFVTGASGWIGSAVVPELVGAGHQVIGLARSDAAAAKVAASGAEVLRGDVQDIDVLRAGAERADGVVHLAFRHDIAWTGHFEEAAASDRRAIEVFGGMLDGSDGPLVVAAGVAGLRPGGIATERDLPSDEVSPRAASERAVLALADRSVRSISVRFAPTVHGAGDHGFIARIVDADRSHGAAGYVGEGENRWAAVHRSDAARLVRLAIEHAPGGSVLHAVGEEGIAMRDIAEAISHRFALPATPISLDEAGERFGFLAQFVGLDMAASSAITRELLGWEPTGPTLVEDIQDGAYSNGSQG